MNVALTITGIAVPALLLVIVVRRWIVHVRWPIAFLFLALTFAFLNGAVFTSKLPVPVDEAARGYPYRGVFGDVSAKNPLTNDTVKLFLPWMQVAREELFHFRAPLWNRYAFSGYPLLGNGESAPFSPFFLVTLFVPLPKQIVAMAGLKVFAALLFGYLFLKREQMSDAAAIFGSSAFAFSVFQTVFLYYSTVTVTSLLPAAFFALFYALETASKRGVVLTACVVAALMASGHPESVLHIAIGAFVLFAIDFALSGDRRSWLARFRFPVAGAVAGLAISMPAWIPVALQVLRSTRLVELRSAVQEAPVPWTAVWALVAPNGFGNPVRHNWSWIRNYSTIATSYVGLIVLAAFIAAVLSRRVAVKQKVWASAALLMFLVAMQWTVIGSFASHLPMMNISANDKLRFVCCFLVAAVAAKWLDSGDQPLIFGVVSLSLAGLAGYAYWKHPALTQPADLIAAAALMVLVFLLVLMRGKRFAEAAAVLSIAELFVLNVPFNALVDAKYFHPRLPIIEALRARAPKEPFRIAAFDWAFLPNAAAQYALEDVRGSDPMSYAHYTDFLSLISTKDAGTDVLRLVNADHPAIDFLNVRFLIGAPDLAPGGRWRRLYSGADGALFENRNVLPRFFAPAAIRTTSDVTMHEVAGITDFRAAALTKSALPSIKANGAATVDQIESVRPAEFHFRVQSSSPALVVSSEPYDSGWSARAKGARLRTIEVNHAFLGVYVPAGESRVDLSYRPAAYWGSVCAAVVAGLSLLLWQGRGRRLSGSPEVVE